MLQILSLIDHRLELFGRLFLNLSSHLNLPGYIDRPCVYQNTPPFYLPQQLLRLSFSLLTLRIDPLEIWLLFIEVLPKHVKFVVD